MKEASLAKLLSFPPGRVARRDDLHLARRLFHFSSGVGLIILSYQLPQKSEWALFLGSLLAFDLLIEGSRLIWPALNLWILDKFKSVLREGEEARLSGITYYLLGCVLSVLLFPRDIAILSILFLAMGDPIAAVVGVVRGRRYWPADVSPTRKTLEGSLACFVFCGLATWAMSFLLKHTGDHLWTDRLLFAMVGGFAAALGELLPLRADDNFSMPLISGTCLWTVGAFFNLLPGLYF